VGQRRAEIGIRMALGATPGLVVRQVLTYVLMAVGIGVALGFGACVWLSQFVASLLYGLRPRDPATLIGAAVVLAGASALAGRPTAPPPSRAARPSRITSRMRRAVSAPSATRMAISRCRCATA